VALLFLITLTSDIATSIETRYRWSTFTPKYIAVDSSHSLVSSEAGRFHTQVVASFHTLLANGAAECRLKRPQINIEDSSRLTFTKMKRYLTRELPAAVMGRCNAIGGPFGCSATYFISVPSGITWTFALVVPTKRTLRL
jgi:hypothetical protein